MRSCTRTHHPFRTVKNFKSIFHHRGTEDTEKIFLLLAAPQAQLTINLKCFSLCPLCLCGESLLTCF